MAAAIAKDKVVLVVVGPEVCAVAYTMHKGQPDVVMVAPTASYAPGAKSYATKEDHYAAIGAWVEGENARANSWLTDIAGRKSTGARVVVVMSAKAVKHDPKGKVYSPIAAIESVLTGLDIMADEKITVA